MKRTKGKALKVSKQTRTTAMLLVDAFVTRLGKNFGFRIDPGAESHRRFKAACVDDAADILDGRIREES